MFERNLILKHITVKDSFLHISNDLSFLKVGTCVRLTDHENNVFYFTVGVLCIDLEDNCVGINSLFAKTLGITDSILFRVSELPLFPTIKCLTIYPLNQNEYEVIELLSENVQETLLNQIRAVYSGEKVVIWIGNNISAIVTVGNINPVSPGVIDFLTEVHIEPYYEKVNIPDQKFHFKSSGDNIKTHYLEKYINTNPDLIFRIAPINKLPNQIFSKNFTVFVSKKCVNIKSGIYAFNLVTHNVFSKELYVKLKHFDTDVYQKEELFVSDQILELLGCQLGARVILKSIESYPLVTEIQINSKKNYSVDVINTFKEFIAEEKDSFVLNSETVIDIGNGVICNLKFLPDEPKFCVIDDNLVRNCSYVINIENVVEDVKVEEVKRDIFLLNVCNFKEIVESLLRNFYLMDNFDANCLIVGKAGTGKSSLLHFFSNEIQNYPYLVHVKQISCKRIKGKTMDSLNKLFSTAFSELLLHQPSILVLDDLHILCESIHGDEISPNNIYFNRISEMLHIFLKSLSQPNKIGILASSECVDKLNKNIYSTRGNHLFKNIYLIQDLTKNDRMVLLKFLFKNFKLDINEPCMKTEGFVIKDLIDFTNKTKFELAKYEPESRDIQVKYIEKALKNTSVISLQNVKLHTPGDKDFSHIGGLWNVKKVLFENLLWPGQYPNIFANAPLRLQSGLLLYGPPGSGKTLLAGAAAKECGMRLISVKGPELLSKYIGASEQAVRDIFQKAQSARPCILFFDEFDSLAPKRGHDNTGVTDRVVNQLLTQLDGVESLIGVCVLAATSRPDLLDSALLRPGRLDKQLLCPLPDKEARLDILRILSKNLNLDKHVSLEKIAIDTENYSGADLQSLLYTSHMLTIDYSVEDNQFSMDNSKITQSNLEDALKKTKPSLSIKERRKYERIYTMFENGVTVEDLKTGTRATLA